jgi:polyphosphate kinase
MITPALLERAHLVVRRHFALHMPAWLVFHDLEHTLSVVRAAVTIGRGCGLSEEDLRTVELAALFHDTGYAQAYAGHERHSAAIARAFLKKHGVARRTMARVNGLILCTRMQARPRSLAQRVLHDADHAKAGQADFEQKAERLRLEQEHLRGRRIGAKAWALENLAYLRAHRFLTAYAQARFGPQRTVNQRVLEARLASGAGRKGAPVLTRDRFFNRDLSWLSFNARVLQEALDPRVPLLDRLKFMAIHSSNLDEFYRVRVAHLRSLRKLAKGERSALEVPPEKLVDQINAIALEQQRRLGRAWREDLQPALAAHGIRFLNEEQLDKRQRTHVQRFFTERVAPLLQTAPLRPGNAPFIEDRKLYLVVRVRRKGAGGTRSLLVNVPSEELGRFIVLPAPLGRIALMFLDDAIRLCAPAFFIGTNVLACHAIKLSRDADLYLDEEFAGTVAEKVRRSLRKRLTGLPARFLYDSDMPADMLEDLRTLLKLKKSDLVRGGRYHNFSDLMSVPATGRAELREAPRPPLTHPAFARARDPFAVVRKADRLLHFPYQDFRTVIDLLRRAARDPAVRAIHITLYRVARGSLVCEALLEALRRGKQVTAIVEVQARFDEGNNLFWGEALEQAGATVTFGREGLKVHCKLCLIERREGQRIRRYAYLGTGNFNERTATLYGDMALLTAEAGITADVAAVFAHLRDHRKPLRTRTLLVAPTQLRAGLERLIDREIYHAVRGRRAELLLKMNSLEDRPLISKLYDASRAGVRVRMIVRGICCLIPGVPGMSEHIEVVSLVDRYLEHARAFVFHNNGQAEVYLGSADLMERNLDRRVEVAFPVRDPELRQVVIDALELQWRDQAKARSIDAEQGNTYHHARWQRPGALRAQNAQYTLLAKGRG